MSESFKSPGKKKRPSHLRERLLFVIWLAGRELGIENAKDFADAIDKNPSQLSQWVTEEKRPSWDSIKRVADAVKIDPVWLDDPARPGAVEPPDFAQWFAARISRERLA